MEEEILLSKDLFKTLSVDTRAEILKLLEHRQMTSSELSRALNKHVTTIAEHLEQLVNANLVERVERLGHKWIYYRLTKHANRILNPNGHFKWAVVLSLSFLIFLGSFVYALNANPSEPLYGLKRFTESTRLLIASSEPEKVSLHMQIAEERLKEAKVAAERNDTETFKEVVNEYKRQVENANIQLDKAQKEQKEVTHLLEKITEDTAKHISILENIEEKHPTLKDEIKPAYNVSVESFKKAKSELEVVIKENYKKIKDNRNESVLDIQDSKPNFTIPIESYNNTEDKSRNKNKTKYEYKMKYNKTKDELEKSNKTSDKIKPHWKVKGKLQKAVDELEEMNKDNSTIE